MNIEFLPDSGLRGAFEGQCNPASQSAVIHVGNLLTISNPPPPTLSNVNANGTVLGLHPISDDIIRIAKCSV